MNTEIVGTQQPTNQSAYVPPEPLGPVVSQPVVPQPQPSETFVGQATDTISGLADRATTGATNLLQRAQSLAPSVLGSDPAAQAANEEILRRQQRQ